MSDSTVVRISKANTERLDALAERTGRTKTHYLNKALEAYLEDIEDYELGVEALRSMKRRYSIEEVAAELGMDDILRRARAERSQENGPGRGGATAPPSGRKSRKPPEPAKSRKRA